MSIKFLYGKLLVLISQYLVLIVQKNLMLS